MAERGITALLGPTNTGKTHHAVERMLEHSSGMIGLPLRLLAREVYDKVSIRVGESKVALVTGEEQRIPRHPAYWVATVEAMPVEREVDFLAVDEVQLAAHRQRGHVFTSRLLDARGRLETWFLGADTMRNVLRELVPTARHVDHPRLSRLSHAGPAPIGRLPPRSAVVAFSVPHVYELADRLRARRGGAAVVLGALSPRTRNAQVAMFQAGEVDCLVATDAIGMGLNLGVEHVAFAATRKFDGREVRDVEDAELAQIAGRAGRYLHDGTFGALTPLDLAAGSVRAIEAHAFPPVRRVQWRSLDLDFASVAALRESLAAPPKRAVLQHVSEAEDAALLRLLAVRDEVRARATSPDSVRLLWDVCTIPDFRKLMLEVHADFLVELYVELVDRGRLRDAWIERRFAELSGSAASDIDDLVARIASTRTFTYVSHRSAWLESPEAWQAATRDLEDRLSDRLHERLVLRFVDTTKKARRPDRPRETARGAPADPDLAAPTFAHDPAHPFAALSAFRAKLGNAPAPRPTHAGVPGWAEEIIEADHAALRLDEAGAILAPSGRIVGRLARGKSIALPDVRLTDADDLGAGARSQVQRRLLAFARDLVSELVGGIGSLKAEASSASLRGLVHRLEQGLGTTLEDDRAAVRGGLGPGELTRLEDAGVVLGHGVVFLPHGLEQPELRARAVLAKLWFGSGRALDAPAGGAVSFVAKRSVPPEAFAAIGYPVIGPRAIRADVLDRLLRAVHASRERDREEDLDEAVLASWIGAPRGDLRKVLAALA